MAEWTIYNKDGVAKALVKELELHDEWMAECFVTVTVKSADVIDFAVGDYIDYRGERYSINYDPSKIKKARRNTYGEGFVYDGIKFVAVQDELVRCDFCDIVLSDNQTHYTQLSTFPFYCENVDDLLDRIQANMEELYPGGWVIVSPDIGRDRQRGLCVGREQAFVDAYNRYIGAGTDYTYEKTGVALTVDNINCWEALSKAHSDFDLNFIIRDRVVIVGTAGVFTANTFRYGKGNGLTEIDVIGDSEQKVVTRLRAYGSENNLPERYYATKGGRPFFSVSYINPASSTEHGISVMIDNDRTYNVFTHLITDTGSSSIYTANCEMDGIIFGASFELVATSNGSSTCTTRMLIGADGYPVISGLDLPTVPQATIDALKAAMVVGSRIIFNSGVNMSYVDSTHIAHASGLPENIAVNRLMLPGFPDMSLDAWVRINRPELISQGYTFSTNALRPYIDSPSKEKYGIRPSNIYFDGSDETDDIFPTISGMTWLGHACDVVLEATQITDNGVLPEDAKEAEKKVSITIPDSGFSLSDKWQDGATISMKDGMCGARDFKILKKPTKNDDDNWVCVCERAYDSTLHLYFPYSDFQIHTGDHFVLTGIELPDSYVEAASVRLFDAAMDALKANQEPRSTYQPKIDKVWMARQHDRALASGGMEKSLHDTLKAGDMFVFADTDLGIHAAITIDVLSIKENGDNGIPTYEVTLRDEKVVSTLQKLQDKVGSVFSGGVNGAGGGGGYNTNQVLSLIQNLGREYFLSRVFDDEAEGNIEFNKNITIKGKGYADEMVSSEYTGEGMLDTGYRLWYENGRAKLVIDDLTARGKFSVYELETRIMTHAGGDVVFSGAGSKIFYVEYLNGDGESMGYTNINSPWMFNEKMLLAGVTGRAAWSNRRRIQKQLTQEQRAQVVKFRCYVYSDDGTMKTRNWWHTHDLARCQTFDHTQLKHNSEGYYSGENVTNTVYWRRVAGIGSKEIEGMDDGKIYDYFDLWNVLDVSQETYYDPATETDVPIGYDIEETDPETGEVTYAYTTPGYDTNYNDWPAAGDQIVQFGNARDIDRQSMITLEVTGGEPGMKVYNGVHTYNMSGTKWVGMGYDATTKRAYADIFGDCYIGERGSVDPRDGSTYVRYNSGTKRLDIKAHITAASTYGEDDLSLENFIKGVTWTKDQIVDMIGEGVEIVQQQLDGNFTIWYGDATPTLYNDPASGWTTDQLKDEHLYDLFYDRTHDMGYRWSSHQDGDTVIYEWQRIPSNNNIIASLREAAHAQDTADGKRRVFLNTPVPPYDAGDLWVNADYRDPSTQAVIFDNDLVKCKTAKARGQQFSISDWEKASKYTDDSALDEFKGQRYVLELTNGTLRTDINSYQYVKDALSNETEVVGGLMLTTMIGLRNKENGQYKTWGGINGAYQNGSTIAAWYGGGMVDYEALTTEQQAMGWDYYRWATSLFRMNGSGYVAGGNISWDDNGNVVIKGDRIGASQIYIGNQDITNYFVKKAWFDDIFQVFNDKTRIYTNDALPSDKSKMNIKAMFGFWTEFYLSALGTGGQTSLNIYLAQLGDVNTSGVKAGEYLMYDGTRWVSSSVGATTSLSSLSDVSVSGVLNGQALVYNSTTQTWEPGTGGVDMASVWSAMSVASNEQINESHLSTALSTYAKTSQIPTNNNQLSNGAGYITSSALSGYATTTWVGQQGYLTSSSLNGYATTTWVGNNYLPLGGGNMSSGARIGFNGGNGYLGNSNNAGWLCVQDICSQASAGDGYWSIRTNGNAIFTNVYSYGAVSAQSDERKKDIVENAELSVEQVAEAPAKKFYWKDKRDEELHVGSIAQYWQKVLPEAVTENNDALSMDYGVISLMSVIATARKVVEQEERIASLEKEIVELKNMLNLALRGNGS